jgi:GNAT superfamily N-acetyltransferase
MGAIIPEVRIPEVRIPDVRPYRPARMDPPVVGWTAMSVDYFVRPMTPEDVPAVERLSDDAFFDLDTRLRRPGWPEPARRGDARSAAWRDRAAHLVGGDPRGCWVAEDDAGLLGAAISMRRDLTWLLATYVVRPGVQGRGVGRQLLSAALDHGSGSLRGMISASDDPLAVRRYRLAGFTLHPAMLLRGVVARASLPVVERLREGSAGDIDLMNSVDRQVRGAAHGADHLVLTRAFRLVVADRPTGSGYAYVTPEGGAHLLAATNRRIATDLLWEALAASSPDQPVTVEHVTAPNEWAVDVGIAGRLQLWTSGYLALRGMKPPMPYLHSGSFL